MSYITRKEPELTYALDPSGRMVSVGSVERGLACNCRCPKCKQPVIAKKGEVRKDHFAHQGEYASGQPHQCTGYFMTAIHRLAEQIISEEKAVMLPEYFEIPAKRQSFVKVEIEQRSDRGDLQPDIVGITEDGQRILIEIRNTHETDDNKRDKIIESEFCCLEIDVKDREPEELMKFLLDMTENRKWINNPEYDQELEKLLNSQIEELNLHTKYNQVSSSKCYSCPHGRPWTCDYKKGIVTYRKDQYAICVYDFVPHQTPPSNSNKQRLQSKSIYQRESIEREDYYRDRKGKELEKQTVFQPSVIEEPNEAVKQFLKSHKVNGVYDFFGRKTCIVNIDQTCNGQGVVIHCIDENHELYSRPVHVLLLKFPSGSTPNIQMRRDFLEQYDAEKCYGNFKQY